VNYTAKGITDTGKRGRENQDAFRILKDKGFFIVADGISGLQDGAIASNSAADALCDLITKKIKYESTIDEIYFIISNALIELSNQFYNEGGNRLGTTIVLALIKGNNAFIAHLGDSRAYILSKGRLLRLTEDHNLFYLLSKSNKFSNNIEILNRETRNMLTKFIGMKNADPEVKIIKLEYGDRLLLCSDGLSGFIEDQEIEEIVSSMQSPTAILTNLIEHANDAGSYDDITAIIIEYTDDLD
jgi:protein phosphatase